MMNCYVVDRGALSRNIKKLQERAGDAAIWAVVKGDGYGLGIHSLAEVLRENGIHRFCVTEPREAASLRESGSPDEEILMLRETVDPDELAALADAGAILTIGSTEAAEAVNKFAEERGVTLPVHIKIDTGMGRYGFFPTQTEQVAEIYRTMPHLHPCGIYTHFNCAFADKKRTRRQLTAFSMANLELLSDEIYTGTGHWCNSSAFLRFPEILHGDAVRLGSALLGRMSFPTDLELIGYVRSRVDAMHMLPKGHTTGYGAMWRAKKDTPIAIIPVGWYHGFQVSCQPSLARRRDALRAVFSSAKQVLRPRRVYVEINGKRCPVVGAVGMLHIAVDVSSVSCAVGDPVVLQVNPLHVKGMPIVFE